MPTPPTSKNKNTMAADLVVAVASRKKTIKELTDELKGDDGLEAQLAEALASPTFAGKLNVPIDGQLVSATRVQAERAVLDEMKLKKALGAAVYAKLTTASLDQAKLRDALAAGTVDPNVVAACTEMESGKPYVKITTKPGGVHHQPVVAEPSPDPTTVRGRRAPSPAARKLKKK